MSFAKEAWVFVLPLVAVAILLLWLDKKTLAMALFVIAAVTLLFFRIPSRVSSASKTSILAPANGRVTRVDVIEDPLIGKGEFHRIVTFLSVFDVHVQRTPTEGRVIRSSYAAGRKVAAFREDAGELNEQILTVLERDNGDVIGLRQIAGLLARRVVSYLEKGDRVERGQLFGLIKFSSRVDLFVPVHYHLEVEVGQRLHEGQSVVATDRRQTMATPTARKEPEP
jgi:phosphatidylserine decarboxylase